MDGIAGSGGSTGASGSTGRGGNAGTGREAGMGGVAGSSGSTGNSGSAGMGGSGATGAGGTGQGTPDAAGDGRRDGATAGSGGSDAGVGNDAPGASGSAGRDSGLADVTADAIGDTREASVADGPLTGAWLHTSGNHLYRGASVFHGRGANFHDTRSCNACTYAPPVVAEVNRRTDELIDNWKATFVRLDLENSLTADNRVQWQGVLDDPAYQADIQSMVTHATAKGAYVLLSLKEESTNSANDLPTDATNAIWRKLADMFKNEPNVLYGITSDPRNDTDSTVWNAMNDSVAAIRAVEAQAGAPSHIIAVQGTQQWGRILDYYVTHPIAAGGGQNIVYETHVYNPASDFNMLFEIPGQTLPVIIGEFGEQDADDLMQRAEAAGISYLAWTFHGRCPPNLLVDNSGGGCGVGMELVPTAFGQQLKDRLATPW
ncbi:MAG TPA: cellulase family glycosylhydrolase [Polyangiaceae bacterium]|nr:cellulase family glycosylhydrolase [Polyangiaceae bacterium]